MLKRKHSDCSPTRSDDTPETTPSSEFEESSCDSMCGSGASGSTEPTVKKKKKNVQFNGVTVFYFRRSQGFTCVPSQGGSTLGMANSHDNIFHFSLNEFAMEQERVHKEMLKDQIRQRRRQQALKFRNGETSLDEEEEDDDEDSNTEEEIDKLNINDYYFLQPVPTKKRRILLRSAGVKKIDSTEKRDCKLIRISREVCGCDCKVYCDPETCACSLANIKCQVDRLSFPCGCSKDGCGNLQGRIEFNPVRVRTHFIHTLMRLDMESNQNDLTSVGDNADNRILSSDNYMNSIGSHDVQNGNSEVGIYHNQNSIYGGDNSQVYTHQYHAEDTSYRIADGPMSYHGQDNVQVEITSHSSSSSGTSSSDESFTDCSSQDSFNYDSQTYQGSSAYELELGTFDENTNQEMCMVGSTSTGNFSNSQSDDSTPNYANLMSSSSSCVVSTPSQSCSSLTGFNNPTASIGSGMLTDSHSYSCVSSSHTGQELNQGYVSQNHRVYGSSFTHLSNTDAFNTASSQDSGIFAACEPSENVTSSQNGIFKSQNFHTTDMTDYPSGPARSDAVCSSQGDLYRSSVLRDGLGPDSCASTSHNEIYHHFSQDAINSNDNASYLNLTNTSQNEAVCVENDLYQSTQEEAVCSQQGDLYASQSDAGISSLEEAGSSESDKSDSGNDNIVSTSTSDVCDSEISLEMSTEKLPNETENSTSNAENCSNTLQPIQNSDSEADLPTTATEVKREFELIESLPHQNFGEAIKTSMMETVDVSV
ncbi:uncharacterized protein LOC102802800 [Saccoglossus kowalevskii]